MNKFQLILPFALYLVVLVAIGFYTYRFTKTMEGFHLGGRKLNPWVAGISILFSGSSGWIFLGCAGLGYSLGPATWFMLISFMCTMLFAYLFLGKRTRNYSGILNAITYPEYFVRRVRSKGQGIRIVAAGAVLIFMSVYVASQYVAAAKAISPMFDITPLTAILITAVVVVLYCLVGGFTAVCWTDFVQGVVILIGSIAICVFLLVKAGGFDGVVQQMQAIDPNMLSAKWVAFPTILAFMTAGLGGLGRPHDTIRFFALKDSHSARQVAMVGEIALLFNYWTGYMLGYLGRIFFPALSDPETIFPTILMEMVSPLFAGIMLAALMALIMSTIDSQLLSAASTLSEDFYHQYINKNASEKKLVWFSRLAVLLIGGIGIVLAMSSSATVNNLVLFATAGLSATFGPSLILSLYWKRLTEPGIICSMIGGFVISVAWYLSPLKAATSLHEAFVGVFCSFIIAIVVSLMTAPPPIEEIEEELKVISKDYNAAQLEELSKKGYGGIRVD